MKAILILTTASACLLAASAAHANLVLDGGFDTNPWAGVQPTSTTTTTTSPWHRNNDAGPTGGASFARTGSYGMGFGPLAGGDSLWQNNIATIAGDTYTLTFWLNDANTVADQLTVSLDSTVVITVGPPINTSGIWKEFTASVVASQSGSTLTFFINPTDPTFRPALDDIDLELSTPVPEPTTLIAGGLLLLPFGASALRRFRKNTSA